MKKFIQNLLSDANGQISHKRTIAVGSFIMLAGMAIASFFGAQLNENLIWVFTGLAGGQSIFTVIAEFKK